ncbi:MAG: DoxX family protein [Ferruginibacter sp.]
MQKVSLYTMSLLFVLAGLNHFLHKEFYIKIMPSWIGFHEQLVIVSGVFEILFALLLLPSQTRRFASWGLILLLITVFPANIQMMLNYVNQHHSNLWISIVRLPIQILLIWWAYTFAKKSF